MPKLNANKNNNYFEKPKENCIETPEGICECIYDNLINIISKDTKIFDLGCARGNLSRRFYNAGFDVTGVDIYDFSKEFQGKFFKKDFFKFKSGNKSYQRTLVLCNPPWNNPKKLLNLKENDWNEVISINVNFLNKKTNLKGTRKELKNVLEGNFSEEEIEKVIGKKYEYAGMKYFPEMFMKHIFDIFGEECKVVLLTIYGFLMNNGINSKRYKWLRDNKFKLTSVLEMPKDTFKDQDIDIWNHILFFNISKLQPIWFLEDKYLNKLRNNI